MEPKKENRYIALFWTDGVIQTDDMEEEELLDSYFDFIIFIRKNDLHIERSRINIEEIKTQDSRDNESFLKSI